MHVCVQCFNCLNSFVSLCYAVVGGTSSFKKKKAGKQKSLSSSEHNWNALFLGLNAVADVMAGKYNTKKSEILDAESSQSLAVRMALGETQIVAETRKFLVSHGVKLDVFGQVIANIEHVQLDFFNTKNEGMVRANWCLQIASGCVICINYCCNDSTVTVNNIFPLGLYFYPNKHVLRDCAFR